VAARQVAQIGASIGIGARERQGKEKKWNNGQKEFHGRSKGGGRHLGITPETPMQVEASLWKLKG
jgi:hypothetical protein